MTDSILCTVAVVMAGTSLLHPQAWRHFHQSEGTDG